MKKLIMIGALIAMCLWCSNGHIDAQNYHGVECNCCVK